MTKRTPKQELLAALKNRRNKSMPVSSLSCESKLLFYTLNTHWHILHRRVRCGQDIFAGPVRDFKSMAANDKGE
jgi:hypothetical protein